MGWFDKQMVKCMTGGQEQSTTSGIHATTTAREQVRQEDARSRLTPGLSLLT